MLTRAAQSRTFLRRAVGRGPRVLILSRRLVAAPKPGDGPLMERRSDRELPDVDAMRFRWSRTLPTFLAIMVIASLAIFNYQKYSSSIVASTMYSLRTSKKAREYLGDDIYFKHRIPWIGGEMNQLKGRININFSVKGSKNEGLMRFASHRPSIRGVFETTEWSLETTDGRKLDLLEGADAFETFKLEDHDRDETKTRGFRQMNKT